MRQLQGWTLVWPDRMTNTFSSRIQLCTNQFNKSHFWKVLKDLLPFIFKQAPYRWLFSKQLPKKKEKRIKHRLQGTKIHETDDESDIRRKVEFILQKPVLDTSKYLSMHHLCSVQWTLVMACRYHSLPEQMVAILILYDVIFPAGRTECPDFIGWFTINL